MPRKARDRALLADIGGTNARFALADTAAVNPLLAETIRDYRVKDFDSLAAAASCYQAELGVRAAGACFAVAGRVDGDSVRMTNHHWHVSLRQTQAELALDRLHVINDFYALAMGVPRIGAEHLCAIGPAADGQGSSRAAKVWAVLGPGTGLGCAALMRFGDHYHVLETEGGHIGFAPRSQDESALLGQLHRSFVRVSNERLISGVGLQNIHQALAAIAGEESDPLRPEDITDEYGKAALAQEPLEDLRPEQITARAQEGGDVLCVRTMETFVRVFGAVAGDAVLGFGAWDGVYLAGGLIPHILPWLQSGAFRQRFEDKGRFQDAMQRVPTLAILHPQPGLLGTAVVAARDAGALS